MTGRRWLAALQLPDDERETIAGCLRHVDFLDNEVSELDRAIAGQALGNDAVLRLMIVPGAGVREVDLLPALRDELAAHKAAARRIGVDDLVFPTARGAGRDKDNARERVVRPVVRRADELLDERGLAPLPVGVTAHKLRHTFASILVALGGDPAYVMGQLGHADPKFTLRVYAHQMRRGDGEREALRALVGAEPVNPSRASAAPLAHSR